MSVDDVDFDDPLVRGLIEKNHAPEESWNHYSVRNLAHEVVHETNQPGEPHIFCTFCHQKWPCETRQALLAWHQNSAEAVFDAKVRSLLKQWGVGFRD